MNHFGPHFKALMKAREIEVLPMANALGVSKDRVIGWRKSIDGPKFADAVLIARYLNMSLQELAEETVPGETAISPAEAVLAMEKEVVERRHNRGKGRPSSDADSQRGEQ